MMRQATQRRGGRPWVFLTILFVQAWIRMRVERYAHAFVGVSCGVG
jgi:hypothetical protein